MSAAGRLRERCDELLASIERGVVPRWARADLAEFLPLSLQASGGRAEAAAEINAKRSEDSDVIRGRIRAVVGAMPLMQPMDELVSNVCKRLAAKGWTAGEWTIRDELRQLRKEGSVGLGTETTDAKCYGARRGDQRERGVMSEVATMAAKNQERKRARVLAARRQIVEGAQRKREDEPNAGAAPAAPAPAKEPVCFKRSDFVLRESICNVWAANAPPEMTPEDLTRSATYLPRIQDLRAGDIIWATNHRQRWAAEIYVVDALAGSCATIVLRVVDLPAPLEDTEGQHLPPGYTIVRESDGLFYPQRVADGFLMRPLGEGYRRHSEAFGWTMNYLAVVNRGGPRG